jgi:predicted nucleic acid-binding protein
MAAASKTRQTQALHSTRETRGYNGRINVARLSTAQPKLTAIVDSNILVYALIKDYPDKERHEKCLSLLDMGLKGQLDYLLAVNPLIVAEVFTVLRRLLDCNEAQARMSTMLKSRYISYLAISKEACKNAVEWATQYNIPVNDAMIAACAAEQAPTIFTADEDHFNRLCKLNIKIVNPTA